ncbi:hypothetical protein AAHC03_017261 [Spirometra sp. Aus1]
MTHQVLLGQGKSVTRELTRNWTTALVEYFRTHPTFKLFDPVYSFDHLCGGGIQDLRQSESVDSCSRTLRQLLHSALFHLEDGDRRGLCDVRGTASSPHVREVRINEQMQMEETAVPLLKFQITTAPRLLRLHFGLLCGTSDLPGWLHGLPNVCFIVLPSNKEMTLQQSSEGPLTVASSPVVLETLACSVAAFALQ